MVALPRGWCAQFQSLDEPGLLIRFIGLFLVLIVVGAMIKPRLSKEHFQGA
jgi:hypothetical protein